MHSLKSLFVILLELTSIYSISVNTCCYACFICWALVRLVQFLKHQILTFLFFPFHVFGMQYKNYRRTQRKQNWTIRWTHRLRSIQAKRGNVPAKRHCHNRRIRLVRVYKCSRSYLDSSTSKISRSVSSLSHKIEWKNSKFKKNKCFSRIWCPSWWFTSVVLQFE